MWLGVFLILLGISYLLNTVFHINLPVFRIALGIFVICMGLKILLGSRMCNWRVSTKTDSSVVFNESTFTPKSGNELKREYSVIFGSGLVDLTQLEASPVAQDLELNVVFGEMRVRVPANMALEIKSSAVAGSVEQPEEAVASATGGKLRLKASAVFGSVRIERSK